MSMTTDGPDDPTPTEVKDSDNTDRAVDAAEDERSRLATHPDPTLTAATQTVRDGRSQVEWVPPTVLAARGGAQVIGRAQELNRELMSAVKQAAREQREALRQRLAARGEDLAVTGTGHGQSRTATREGVSR